MSARRSTHASGSHYTGRSRLASRSGAASRASSTRFAGSHIAGVAHTSASASVAASRRGTGYTAAGSQARGVQAPPTSHWERQLRDVKAEAVQARRNQFVSPKPRVVDSYDFEEEPDALCGYVVSIRWSNDWYDGLVLRYNATTKRHYVKYLDGDEAGWYNLQRKTWFVQRPASPGWQDKVPADAIAASERKLPPRETYEPVIKDGELSIEQRRELYAARGAHANQGPGDDAQAAVGGSSVVSASQASAPGSGALAGGGGATTSLTGSSAPSSLSRGHGTRGGSGRADTGSMVSAGSGTASGSYGHNDSGAASGSGTGSYLHGPSAPGHGVSPTSRSTGSARPSMTGSYAS